MCRAVPGCMLHWCRDRRVARHCTHLLLPRTSHPGGHDIHTTRIAHPHNQVRHSVCAADVPAVAARPIVYMSTSTLKQSHACACGGSSKRCPSWPGGAAAVTRRTPPAGCSLRTSASIHSICESQRGTAWARWMRRMSCSMSELRAGGLRRRWAAHQVHCLPNELVHLWSHRSEPSGGCCRQTGSDQRSRANQR